MVVYIRNGDNRNIQCPTPIPTPIHRQVRKFVLPNLSLRFHPVFTEPFKHPTAIHFNTLMVKTLVLQLRQELAHFITHDGIGLKDKDMYNDEDQRRHDHENLDE